MLERLKAGERVEVTHPIDLMPYTVLAKGECGTVVANINSMGIRAIEVKLDAFHAGLKCFDNKALLTAPETDYLRPVGAVHFTRNMVAALAWGGSVTVLGTLKAHAAVLAAMGYGLTTLLT